MLVYVLCPEILVPHNSCKCLLAIGNKYELASGLACIFHHSLCGKLKEAYIYNYNFYCNV